MFSFIFPALILICSIFLCIPFIDFVLLLLFVLICVHNLILKCQLKLLNFQSPFAFNTCIGNGYKCSLDCVFLSDNVYCLVKLIYYYICHLLRQQFDSFNYILLLILYDEVYQGDFNLHTVCLSI